MPKASGLPHLNLAPKANGDFNGITPATLSPRTASSPNTPHSPRSVPTSPFLQNFVPHQVTQSKENRNNGTRTGPSSPKITAMPELPPSPVPQSPKHGRDQSKGFFSNLMASKSSHRLHASETSIPDAAERPKARSRTSSKDRSLHSIKRQESTPDLPRSMGNNGNQAHSIPPTPSSTTLSQPTPDPMAAKSKSKSKFGGILTRTKTVRLDEAAPRQRQPGPSSLQIEAATSNVDRLDETSPKTAPIHADHRNRAFATENGATLRNRSVDRHARDDTQSVRREKPAAHLPPAHSFRDQLLSNIGQTGKGMGDRLGKAGKGFFGKITRSGSSNERETIQLTDDNYTCTTITLPLVKQTRKTRIARRLEVSKDKTEFWMPALPWRCIE
jgi:hypothetical protein